MFDDPNIYAQKANGKTSVEVILVRYIGDTQIEVKTDEKARPMVIPRSGIQIGVHPKQTADVIAKQGGHMATLKMTERRAVTVGLA